MKAIELEAILVHIKAGLSNPVWTKRYRNYIVIVLTPLLILPLPLIIPTPEAKCGFVIILCNPECIPLAVTAMLSVILYPMMGIMESGLYPVPERFQHALCWWAAGGHRCRALEPAQDDRPSSSAYCGGQAISALSSLMLGFMSTTAFLCMWISNTASTAMMLLIANAVLQQLCETEAELKRGIIALAPHTPQEGQENQAFEMGDNKESSDRELKPKDSSINMGVSTVPPEVCDRSPEAEQRRLKREEKYMKLTKGMSLSVCYAANWQLPLEPHPMAP